MALPRLPRLVRTVLAPALLVLLTGTVCAAGAVVAASADEPMPASRLPVTRPAQGTPVTQPGPATAPKAPCPHPHKCTGTTGAAR